MGSQTTNYDFNKPAKTDNVLIGELNENMDILDGLLTSIDEKDDRHERAIAIVADGNTHIAIGSGQFVYVRGHNTLAEGLYKATADISENGTLSTSNLTESSSGGLNAVRTEAVIKNRDLVNNLSETGTGKALDARQGKTLGDSITAINGKIGAFREFSYTVTGSSDDACVSQALDDILSKVVEGSFIARVMRSGSWLLECCGAVRNGAAFTLCYNTYNGDIYVFKKNVGQDIQKVNDVNSHISNIGSTSSTVRATSAKGTLLDGGAYLAGKLLVIQFTFKAAVSATNSPGILNTDKTLPCDASLSAIDITSGISTAITSSVPCGISANGQVFIRELVTDHIYAISGVVRCN